jgi:hypothetical protein
MTSEQYTLNNTHLKDYTLRVLTHLRLRWQINLSTFGRGERI